MEWENQGEGDILKINEGGTSNGNQKEISNVKRGSGEGRALISGHRDALGPEGNRSGSGIYVGPVGSEPKESGTNYRITESDQIGQGTLKEKYQSNITAIRLIKQLESEQRKATLEEQRKLVKYVGWGSLSQVFDPTNKERHKEFKELRNLLSPDEYDAARKSTISAYYTSPEVIKAVWNTVHNFGFEKGNVLEPAAGIGHFLGLSPNKDISFTAIELDNITGKIAQQLYQNANVHIQGFQNTPLVKNSYDLAISNVPFSDYKPFDPKTKKLGIPKRLVLHDYFFAKSLTLVKPGGIVAFITSAGTMDKVNPDFRKYLNDRAKFLGAVRLPSTTFKKNAGTEVVTDIIFLQKLHEGEIVKNSNWIDTEEFWYGNDDKFVHVNKYFKDNPVAVIGVMQIGDGLYSNKELIVNNDGSKNFADDLAVALRQQLPKNIVSHINEKNISRSELEVITPPSGLKEGAFFHQNNKIYQNIDDQLVEQDISAEDIDRIIGLIEIRNTVRNLLSKQIEDVSEEEIESEQNILTQVYDEFVDKHGNINNKINTNLFWDDPDSALIASLEIETKKIGRQQHYRKHDIFTDRVLVPHRRPEIADSTKDALFISLGEYGRLDFEYMSDLLGKPKESIQDELLKEGAIFKDPSNKNFILADEYLSGNVKEKLAEAEQSVESDSIYKSNIEQLNKVIPEDLTFDQIDVRVGMPWIKPMTYQEFLGELLDGDVTVLHNKADGSWKVERGRYFYKESVTNVSEWGTKRVPATKIFELIANSKPVKVFDTFEDADGIKRKVLNEEATVLAESKAEIMKNRFEEWFWDNEERRKNYLMKYNMEYNNTVKRKYDGSHLVFPAQNPNAFPEGLRSTQLDAIWRGLTSDRLMLAHEVGAGKTAVMITTAMESKRLGLLSKTMMVVPRNTLPGWKTQINQLYPAAKVLIADDQNFAKDKRKRFLSKIATGNWDMIVIPESSFSKISVSLAALEQYMNEEIAMLRESKEEMKAAGSRITIKQIEKAILAKEEKLKEILNQSKKDDVVTFEELGIDALFVDEADKFKNLAYATQKQGIKGMGNPTGANKTADMMMKIRIIQEKNGKIIFATGTPISNSMVEAHSMMRYLQPEILRKRGITSFDDWSNTFGEVTTSLEVDVTGKQYKIVSRFSKFVNIPELMSMLEEVWDVQTSKMLERAGILVKGKNLPLIKGGQAAPVIINTYPELAHYQLRLIARAKIIKDRKGAPQKGDDIMLTVLHDGLMSAIDMRIIDPTLPANFNSKVEATIRGVVARWKRDKEIKGTQIIFLDKIAPNKTAKFNPHYYMRSQMINAGIPEKEIAFIHDFPTREKQTQLFESVNGGDIRIIFGSTEKLGAGTNIQTRLKTLWHMDQPFRPRDIIQREGRILRPGNMNKEIEIMRLSTKESLDTFMWQLLESKAKSIEQIMSGQGRGRSLEEDAINEYEALKSLTSGNPLLKEKSELDRDIRKFKALQTAFQREKFMAEEIVKTSAHIIKKLEDDSIAITAFIRNLPERPIKETFNIIIGDKVLKDKKQAHALIYTGLQSISPEKYGTEQAIGEYLGHILYVKKTYQAFADKILNEVGIFKCTGIISEDPVGTFTSLDGAIYDRSKVMLKQAQNQVAESQRKLEFSQKLIKSGFQEGKKLEQKLVRLKEVERQLQKEDEKESSQESLEESLNINTRNDFVPILGIDDVWEPWKTTQTEYNKISNIDEKEIINYHGTSKEAKQEILIAGFKNFGSGVSISQGKETAEDYGDAIIKVRLKKGAVARAEMGLDQDTFEVKDVAIDHEEYVRQALDEGKLVPEEILQSYPELTEKKKTIIKKFAYENKETILEKYAQQYGNIVSIDRMKKFFDPVGYTGIDSRPYQAEAGQLAKKYFDRLLEKNKNTGKKVLLMTGGTGVGKSSAIKELHTEECIVFDLNLTHFEQNSTLIEQITEKGQHPEIIFILRHPEQAFRGVVGRSLNPNSEDYNRIISIAGHIEIHRKAKETFFQLIEKFKETVEYKILDNRRKANAIKEVTIDELKNINYSYKEILEELKNEIQSNEAIPTNLKKAFLGRLVIQEVKNQFGEEFQRSGSGSIQGSGEQDISKVRPQKIASVEESETEFGKNNEKDISRKQGRQEEYKTPKLINKPSCIEVNPSNSDKFEKEELTYYEDLFGQQTFGTNIPKSIHKTKDSEKAVSDISRKTSLKPKFTDGIVTSIQDAPLKVKFKKTGFISFPNQKITSSADVAFAFQQLKNESVERFYVIGIKKSRPISVEPLGIGLINQACIDTFEPLSLLLTKKADSYYLVHNHPSGDVSASKEDIELTRQFAQAYQKLHLNFRGHVIINDTKYGYISQVIGDRTSFEASERESLNLSFTEKKIKVPQYSKYIEWSKGKQEGIKLESPDDAYSFIKTMNADWAKNAQVLYLNIRNIVVGTEILDFSKINVQHLAPNAASVRANAIILANGHLSSQAANNLKEELESFKIKLLDIIEFGHEKTFQSFSDDGILNEQIPVYQNQLENEDHIMKETPKTFLNNTNQEMPLNIEKEIIFEETIEEEEEYGLEL